MAKGLKEADFRIEINISPDLQQLMANHAVIGPEAIKLGLRKITKKGSKNAKQKVKSLGLVRSGTLVKSITGRTSNKKSFIGTSLWYAHFLEGGTDPHIIKPKKKGKNRYLRIPVNGRSLFTKQVRHPGIRAYKPLEKTLDDMRGSGEIDSLFALGVREAIEELSK